MLSSFTFDFDRVERFVLRVTKGLLSFYYPDYDYSDDTFSLRFVEPTRRKPEQVRTPVKDCLRYDSRGDGVIQYRFGLSDTRRSGVWIIVFYGLPFSSFIMQRSNNLLGLTMEPTPAGVFSPHSRSAKVAALGDVHERQRRRGGL